jgi:negative regulator of flagellin synthesis FlgM
MAININNLGGNTQVTAKQAEQQRNQATQQNNNQQQAQAAKTQAPRADSVSLTSTQQMSSAQDKANKSSGFDQDKVDKIKKAIGEGSYKVDASRLAANLISSEGKLFGM